MSILARTRLLPLRSPTSSENRPHWGSKDLSILTQLSLRSALHLACCIALMRNCYLNYRLFGQCRRPIACLFGIADSHVHVSQSKVPMWPCWRWTTVWWWCVNQLVIVRRLFIFIGTVHKKIPGITVYSSYETKRKKGGDALVFYYY